MKKIDKATPKNISKNSNKARIKKINYIANLVVNYPNRKRENLGK